MRCFNDNGVKRFNQHTRRQRRWSNNRLLSDTIIVFRYIKKIKLPPKTRRGNPCIGFNNIVRITTTICLLLMCLPGFSLSYMFRLPTTFPSKLIGNNNELLYQERILWNVGLRKSTITQSTTTNYKKMNSRMIRNNAIPLSSLSTANDISWMFFLIAIDEESNDLTASATAATTAVSTEGGLQLLSTSVGSILILMVLAASVYEATRSNILKKEIAIEVNKINIVKDDLSIKRNQMNILEQNSNVSSKKKKRIIFYDDFLIASYRKIVRFVENIFLLFQRKNEIFDCSQYLSFPIFHYILFNNKKRVYL